MKFGSFIAIACLLAASSASAAPGVQADLALNFECPASPDEGLIEKFLTSQHFQVENLERVRRQFDRAFFPLDIEAIDQGKRTVSFVGLLGTNDRPGATHAAFYTVGLYSPPPTRHDPALEAGLVNLVETSLKCRITSRNSGENDAAASATYNDMLTIEQGRMHEAAICDRTLASYDAKLCAQVPGQ
jgi:hypothetical protein